MLRAQVNGFMDELCKIAAVSLHGLSTETVLEGSQPPPMMPTPGYDKATEILNRVSSIQQTKIAAEEKPKKRRKAVQQASSGAGAGLSAGLGAASGKSLAELGTDSFLATNWANKIKKPATQIARQGSLKSIRWTGGLLGGAAGLGTHLYKKHKAKQKQAQEDTPGMQLKATSQVAKTKNVVHAGPTINDQIKGRFIK